MTGEEGAYFRLNPSEKPAHLFWLGAAVPQKRLPKLPRLYPILFGAIAVQLVLVLALDTRMDDQPNPLRDFATYLLVVLIITTAVVMARRVMERDRSMTPDEHRYFFEHREEKPAHLFWPGAPIPQSANGKWADTQLGRAFVRSPRFMTFAVGGVMAATVVVASVEFAAVPALADDGVVTHIVDGDTLDEASSVRTNAAGQLTVVKKAEDEAIAAAKAAADKAAADALAAQQAEADKAVADAAAEAARRAAESSSDQPGSSGGSSSDSSGGGTPTDAGYTGCRDYSKTGMIDVKGRSFKPIPCS